MNLHKGVGRNSQPKERQLAREGDASYQDSRKRVADCPLLRQHSFLKTSLFAVSAEVRQEYEGTLWRTKHNNSQGKKIPRRNNGRNPVGGRFWQWTQFGERSGWEWMQLLII